MRTRSTRAESAVLDQGKPSKKLWKSPHQNGQDRRQPLQQCKIQTVPSDHQSPVPSKMFKSHANSQIESLKENCLSLFDGPSPIIGSRRRALGVKNVCRDSVSQRKGYEKGKTVHLKIEDKNQKDKASPLQENVNRILSKDKGITREVKTQAATQDRSVVSDKENVLAACMIQTPLRQSKRIRVANRNKDTQNAPKRARKDPSDREQTEAKKNSEVNSLPKERPLRGAGRKEISSRARPQETAFTKQLDNRTSNNVKSRSNENVSSIFDNVCVAAEQGAGGKKKTGSQTRACKATSKKSLKSQTARAQAIGITRSGSREKSNNTCDKVYIAEEQEAGSDKNELHLQARAQKVINSKNLKTRTQTMQGKENMKSGRKWDLNNKCDKVHATAEEPSSDERKESPKTGKDTTVSSRRTSRRSVQRSLDKAESADRSDETPKRTPTYGQSKVKTTTLAQVESNIKKLSTNMDSKRNAKIRSKPPVWASVRGFKVTPGKRKSLRLSSDAYEFTTSPNKEHKEVRKRRVTKPRQRTKKIQAHTKLTLLTTDPSWLGAASKGMPLLTTSAFSSKATAFQETSVDDVGEETSIPSILSSIRDEEVADEDFPSDANFDGLESSDEFHEFEGETRSSLIVPSKGNNKLAPMGSTSLLPTRAAYSCKPKLTGNSSTPRMENAIQTEAPEIESVPMVSANVLPTPVVSKHITKFIGGSSTPRVENTMGSAPNQEAETANDSLAQCFGFSDDTEEESELNISPVQQSRLRHTLEITGTSDVMDGELHPATLPTRFSWSQLRPGNRSRASTTRGSSSMVAQGRSVSFMTDTSSQTSQPTISSFLVPTVEKQRLRLQKKKGNNLDREEDSVSTESVNKQKGADVSVLFDEDQMVEKEPSGEKNVGESSQPSSTLIPLKPAEEGTSNSPKKHFKKAPRKSYERAPMLSARKKFTEMHGGYADADSDTEESDREFEPKPHKKPKKASKKPAKGTEKSSKKGATATSKKKKAAAAADDDPSLQEWASRLNSHFSEVEDSILVVE